MNIEQYAAEAFNNMAQKFEHQVIVEMIRPSVLYRPRLIKDGDQWCAMYGDNWGSGMLRGYLERWGMNNAAA